MSEKESTSWQGTTILSVRKGKDVVIAGDSQVTMGSLILKPNVRRIRRLGKSGAIAGFSGSTVDAIALFERLEAKLEENPHQLIRACVDLAKDWRQDRYLRRLDAMMAVVNETHSILLTGSGDVLEPEDGLIGIGTGGPYALSAARALLDIEGFSARMIVEKAMKISADICVYTNRNIVVESVGEGNIGTESVIEKP